MRRPPPVPRVARQRPPPTLTCAPKSSATPAPVVFSLEFRWKARPFVKTTVPTKRYMGARSPPGRSSWIGKCPSPPAERGWSASCRRPHLKTCLGGENRGAPRVHRCNGDSQFGTCRICPLHTVFESVHKTRPH